jgi:hypothetical protein
MWDYRNDKFPLRRHPKNRALIDTVKDVARNLEVDGLFVRDHQLWVVLMLLRSEKRVTVACRRYGLRERGVYSFRPDDSLKRYWP